MFSRTRMKPNRSILLGAGALAAWGILGLAGNPSTALAARRDRTPPAAVGDLTVVGVTSNTITLEWTATGDDGNTGTADRYDIRYMPGQQPITEQNWDAALQASAEPSPLVPGTVQSYDVTGLSQQTTYYLAMKVRDEANNWSGLSNVPFAPTTTALPGDWVFDVIASEGNAGWDNALAYDPISGYPAIAFTDALNRQLHFTSWNGSSWGVPVLLDSVVHALDLAFVPGSSTATIAYVCDASLKFARKNGSSWDTEIIQEKQVANGNEYVSLAYDNAGNPGVAYYSAAIHGRGRQPAGLRFAHWNDLTEQWETELVDEDASYSWKSLAFDLDGNPAIAYDSSTPRTLTFARWNDTTEQWDIEMVDVGESTAIDADLAFDPDPDANYPAIANKTAGATGVRFVRWDGAQWLGVTVDDSSPPGGGISLVYANMGMPIISYHPFYSVKLAQWNGIQWVTETIQSDVHAVGHTSLAINPITGSPSLSYCHRGGDRIVKFARKQP